MQDLTFLDEIFGASTAILNALLKIANERVFHNSDQEMQAPLISLFCIPEEPCSNCFKSIAKLYCQIDSAGPILL